MLPKRFTCFLRWDGSADQRGALRRSHQCHTWMYPAAARIFWERPHAAQEIKDACYGHARHAMTDDERAIRDLVATWMNASEAGDVRTVLSLMADDVIFTVPAASRSAKTHFVPLRKR